MSEHAEVKMVITCDACLKPITGQPAASAELFGERVDLCASCSASGFFICYECGDVHTRTDSWHPLPSPEQTA